MKKIKSRILQNGLQVIIFLFITSGFFLTSCAKGDPGIQGETGARGDTGVKGDTGTPGPVAKTFNFSITFNQGDLYGSYAGVTGYDADDVLLFYIKYESLSSGTYWAPLPTVVNNINFVPEFNDQDYYVYINTFKADGTTGSPWAFSSTVDFKAVLVKSSQRGLAPNIKSKSYEEIKNTYHLID